ncbi:GNAT family N-acetyltransferase [Planococcus maritimus]|nr:GNAT family N-acetyltransferase [Planococcus sp. SK3692]MDE4085290.1 GNAT family N-acetyltransferase [Planococcus maritimus]
MPHIKTDRLMLITFTAEMMQAAISSERELEQAAGYQVIDDYPSDDYKEILPFKIQRYRQYPEENEWEGLIVHQQNQMIMGDMGFRRSTDNPEELELGYSIVPAYQGHGYATEMAQAIISWGLTQAGIKKIIASCDHDNRASIRVLEKAGLKKLGEQEHKIHWST